MIILFAPSESKREGGTLPPLHHDGLIFPELYEKRLEVVEHYRSLIDQRDHKALSELFGLKNSKEFERYLNPFDNAPTMRAIERYDGVAYEYLNYATLSMDAQCYITEKVLIFSNLFGPIRAGDSIPDYKLKQGSVIGELSPDKFYKKNFSLLLDEWIGEDEILDIRAGFYDKFYLPKNRITTLKFLKEGKVVSHWAKAYRGIVLREIATHNIDSLSDLIGLNIPGLALHQIMEMKTKREIIYTIL